MGGVSHTEQQHWIDRHRALLDAPIPAVVSRRLARLVADTVAIAHHARTNRVGATAHDEIGLAVGNTGVDVWGGSRRYGMLDAAFLNGSAAEALDFQEVLIDGRNNGHAAVVIVPALIAIAAAREINGDRLCRGLWIAFAANIALARALGRGHRRDAMGFRTTSLTAPIAAALGGALMLTGEQGVAAHAVGITAASLPAGLLAAMSPQAGDFSVDKDLSVGFSARHAVHAILLAEAGATGPTDVLSGPRGWLASYGSGTADAGHLDADPLTADLAAYALKLYPANFGCQCAIRLAIDLATEVPADDVATITAHVKTSSAQSLSARDLTTHVAARFSLAYSIASAFVRRRASLADYAETALTEPAVRSFMDKVDVVGDDALEARHHDVGTFPARLVLTRQDGTSIECALERPDDGFSTASAQGALADKLTDLCPPDLATRLVGLVQDADDPEVFSRLRSITTASEDQVE